MPLENSPTARVRVCVSPTISSNCSARWRRSPLGKGEEVAEEIERFVGIEIAIEIRFLRQVADAGLGRNVTRGMPEDFDVPFGGIKQAEQHLHRGGFPRAVRAEQAEDFAAPHRKVDVVDGARLGAAPEVFEDLGEAAYGHDAFRRGGGRGGRFSGGHDGT
jgi:hypothetical protein